MIPVVISGAAVVLAFRGNYLLKTATTKEEIQTALIHSMLSTMLIGVWGLFYFNV